MKPIPEIVADSRDYLVEAGWPYPLIKAIDDPFTYAIGLRDGTIMCFETCEEGEGCEWVRIDSVEILRGPLFGVGRSEFCPAPFNFERGLWLRVSEIMWVADAPYGS